MTDETQPTAPNGGDSQPEALSTGTTTTASGRSDGGTPESSTVDRDAIWAEARRKYEPLAKKAQEEAAAIRKKLAEYEGAEKTMEDFKAEAEKFQTQAEAQAQIIERYAEEGLGKLPEHLQSTLKKAAGDDPMKVLDLLPDFQALANKQTLRTPGGEQAAGSKSTIDIDGIKRAQALGNIGPMRDAISKHGQAAYDAALQDWINNRR